MSTALRVLITGAAGQIGYSLVLQIAKVNCLSSQYRNLKNTVFGFSICVSICAFLCACV